MKTNKELIKILLTIDGEGRVEKAKALAQILHTVGDDEDKDEELWGMISDIVNKNEQY